MKGIQIITTVLSVLITTCSITSCAGLKQSIDVEKDSKYIENDGKTTVDIMYYYKYQETNGEITITQYIGEDKIIKIPVHINGKQVRNIGSYTFSACSDIESVSIPTTIISIGESSFAYCTGLKDITIPHGVVSVGQYAFHECTGLTNITIPKSVTSIENDAFKSCTSLTISGYKNSCAEKYASENNIPFKALD